MAIDDDLSALLPKPPPARPARREAAIDEALRRFDAAGEAAPRPPVSASPKPARAGWSLRQVAAFASVALVLLVSVPIWLGERDRLSENRPQVAPAAARGSLAIDLEPVPQAPERSADETVIPTSADRPDQLAEASASQADAPPMAMLAPSPPTASARADAAEYAPAKRAPELAQAAPAAKAAAPRAASDGSIVVTGARVSREDQESGSPIISFAVAPATHGDWTDCTVLDPRRDLSACRAIADSAAKGATGRAAARLADGLSLAWQGESGRAMDEFDRAIREAPDLSIAYLNRGLVHQSRGDLRRALVDFNRAVERDPGVARNYYHRSLLERTRGATARAEADAKRAIALDPRYQAVLPRSN